MLRTTQECRRRSVDSGRRIRSRAITGVRGQNALAGATRIVVLMTLLGGLSPATLVAQSKAPLELTRVSTPIVIDGVLDDAAWGSVTPLPLTQYSPTYQGTPTQRTEIRVAYDQDYFYAGGWFYDTQPDQIRINSLYRDRWNGDDALALYLDTFHDQQNAKWFGVTAAGMRFDQLVSDDGATLNGNWDTFWTAKTTVSDSGWFVEMRIPFSSLGFRADSTGRVEMGLTVTRLIARADERVTFPAIDPKFEFRRPSQAQPIILRNVHSRTPVHVTPYALFGQNQRAAPSTTSGYATSREASRSMGADVRYPLSSNLTVDLSVNTDFAQAEADEAQINLDRFPLFFPERRRFFQEGSGIFDFVAGGNTRLFHSRRIGLAPDLTPVPVFAGARLVGRAGPYDIGLLDMQTRAADGVKGENFGVLRLRRSVMNPGSTAGLMFTSISGPDRQNIALGGDGIFNVSPDQYLTLKAAATSDANDASTDGLGSRTLLDAKWERRSQRGLAYSVAATRAGRDFEPAMGFMQRRDFTSVNFLANHYTFTDKSRTLRRVYPGALAFSTYRNQSGALESGQYAVWVQWDTKAGGGGWVEPKLFHENVLQTFSITDDVQIPAGSYDFADLQIALSMTSGRKLRTGIDFRSGTYFDGTRTQIILNPTWNISRHLELGGDYQLSHLNFPERSQSATVQLARLRIRTAFDVRRSGNALVQYNSVTGRTDISARFRYAFAEGTDLWLVYNEGLDLERAVGVSGVRAPLSATRTLLLKYSYTVSF